MICHHDEAKRRDPNRTFQPVPRFSGTGFFVTDFLRPNLEKAGCPGLRELGQKRSRRAALGPRQDRSTTAGGSDNTAVRSNTVERRASFPHSRFFAPGGG